MTYNDLPSRVIPGGAHTYSKGDDQFPEVAPRFLERGQGVRVWDDRGTEYLDWMMGLRTMTLGYGQEEVIAAAVDQIHKGSNFGRPSRIEAETANDLIELIPSAEMVKFAKNGSTVTTAAIKLARAYTGRDLVALCADHPDSASREGPARSLSARLLAGDQFPFLQEIKLPTNGAIRVWKVARGR